MFTALASALAQARIRPSTSRSWTKPGHQHRPIAFLCGTGRESPNALFFAGDLGQRIFQQPFSWKSLGVDIRGRSRTLRVNYRTSHQIRMQADRLLGPEVTDVDGNSRRSQAIPFLSSTAHRRLISVLTSEDEEIKAVGDWLTEQVKAGDPAA